MRLFEARAGQVAPARARLEQAKALYALKREQLDSLKVRAGMAGILQLVPLQVGQQLAPGANLAKVAKQAGVPKVIARVRNTEYLDYDSHAFGKMLGIDLIINPEMVTAVEVSQILKTPAALDVEDFAGGKVRMLEVKIRANSPFSGIPLRDLKLPEKVLVAGILRKEKLIIPQGRDTIEDHDSVFFLGAKEAICSLEKSFVKRRSRIDRVLIVGAGRIGRAPAVT